VYAAVFEWNPASIRMLERASYAFEGRLRKSVTKNGQTIDSMLYAIVRERGAGARFRGSCPQRVLVNWTAVSVTILE